MTSKTACEYLKIPLSSPVIVGACPLSMEPELLRQMIACGAGAIVLPSIFQEQITDQSEFQSDPLSTPDPNSCHPHQQSYNGGLGKY